MRLWSALFGVPVLPFVVLACSGIGWSDDANYEAVCVCGVGTPDEFAECIALGYPPDPETCPDEVDARATDADRVGCLGRCAPKFLLDLVSV
jgi:hypothetical protein